MIKLSVSKCILSVGYPSFSVVSGILSVVGIPSVPIPIPEKILLLMYDYNCLNFEEYMNYYRLRSFYFYFSIIQNQEILKNSFRLLTYPDLIWIWNHLIRKNLISKWSWKIRSVQISFFRLNILVFFWSANDTLELKKRV